MDRFRRQPPMEGFTRPGSIGGEVHDDDSVEGHIMSDDRTQDLDTEGHGKPTWKASDDEDTEGHGKPVFKASDDDTEGHGRPVFKASDDDEDTEGHGRPVFKASDDDDTEGHRFRADGDEDDVEGHLNRLK